MNRLNNQTDRTNILKALKENENLKESTDLGDIKSDLTNIETTLQGIYGQMATREGEAVILEIYDLLTDKCNEYGIDPYKEN